MSINNISEEFFGSLNNIGSNPFILVVLVFIILIYYILFAFLGVSSGSNTSSGGFIFIEALLWGLFIILIFFNGLSYFFGINIVTDMRDVFSEEPEIKIETTVDSSNVDSSNVDSSNVEIDTREVYHVPGNRFTYHDAKAICKAFDAEMATYEQLNEAQKKGASWCSYGWTKDQLGYTQQVKVIG